MPGASDEHAPLIKLANTRMPFGRYRGRLFIDLPEPYAVWFRGQGYRRANWERCWPPCTKSRPTDWRACCGP
jgi:hypothetical protein